MKTFLSLVILSCVDKTSAVHFDSEPQSDYIIVAARQRSGSSTLSSVIGGHPCAVDANEIWTDSPSQDILGGHYFTTMDYPEIRNNPREFLSEVHGPICQQSRERGDIDPSCSSCTIVVKMFDIHSISSSGIRGLMGDDSISFVVLERDVQQQFCSLELAHQKGDWGTTPGQHSEKKMKNFECGDVTHEFASKHHAWFNFLRLELFNKGRYFLNVPFDSVASCNLKRVASSIFSFGGLESSIDFEYHDKNIESLFVSC